MRYPFSASALLSAPAIAACSLIASPAQAQHLAEQARIDPGADLAFGLIAAGSTTGDVRVTPQGTQLCAGGVQCLGGARPGLFYVTGRKDYVVSVLVSNALMSNGARQVTARLKPSDSTLVLRPGNRKNEFTVGGTITIDASQASGAYAGSYEVTVEYQ